MTRSILILAATMTAVSGCTDRMTVGVDRVSDDESEPSNIGSPHAVERNTCLPRALPNGVSVSPPAESHPIDGVYFGLPTKLGGFELMEIRGASVWFDPHTAFAREGTVWLDTPSQRVVFNPAGFESVEARFDVVDDTLWLDGVRLGPIGLLPAASEPPAEGLWEGGVVRASADHVRAGTWQHSWDAMTKMRLDVRRTASRREPTGFVVEHSFPAYDAYWPNARGIVFKSQCAPCGRAARDNYQYVAWFHTEAGFIVAHYHVESWEAVGNRTFVLHMVD